MVRSDAIEYAKHYIGTWYKWGGEGPGGFDCSGFMCEILKAYGGLTERLTAQGLYNKYIDMKLDEFNFPCSGCLIFFGKDIKSITHVEMLIDTTRSIGAKGGGSSTITVDKAIEQNAFIKIRPFKERKDMVAILDPFKGLVD